MKIENWKGKSKSGEQLNISEQVFAKQPKKEDDKARNTWGDSECKIQSDL